MRLNVSKVAYTKTYQQIRLRVLQLLKITIGPHSESVIPVCRCE